MKKYISSLVIILISIGATAQTNAYSVVFDGIDDYIRIANNNIFNPSKEITISAWIKSNSWGTNHWDNYIVGKDSWTQSSTSGYGLRSGNNGVLSFNIAANGTWYEAVSPSDMLTNQWYYVSGTFDGTQMNVYINGALKGTQMLSAIITGSNDSVTIGRVAYLNSPTLRWFNGNIDQVEIWNIALNSAQIKQYMECSPIGTEAELAGFWNFEEGGGTSTSDKTVYGNHGELMNGTLWYNDVQTVCISTGTLYKPQNKNALQIYPNPNKGLFEVKSENGTFNIEIINTLGEIIQRVELNSENIRLDLSQYGKGLYLYKFYNEHEILQMGKIIIE
jgi:hypothetical protein